MSKNGYHSIYQNLLDRIENNVLTPGMQLPSEMELGDDFQVSRTTVRRALERLEEEGQIFRRSGIGTFVKAPTMVETVTPKRLNIGVETHPEWGSPRGFAMELLMATQRACAQYNCNLLLLSKEELLTGDHVDAALFFFLDPKEYPRASQLAERMPTLLLNRITDYPGLGYVAIDYVSATAQIIRRMLQNGAEKILFVGGSSNNSMYAPYMRELGYRKAHQQQEIAVDEKLIISEENSRDHRIIAEYLLEKQPEVVFVCSEYYLSWVHTALESVNNQLGGPIYVFCFDDAKDYPSFPATSISCGRMPLDDMCRRAIKHLAGRANREEPDTLLHEIFQMSYLINNCPFLL